MSVLPCLYDPPQALAHPGDDVLDLPVALVPDAAGQQLDQARDRAGLPGEAVALLAPALLLLGVGECLHRDYVTSDITSVNGPHAAPGESKSAFFRGGSYPGQGRAKITRRRPRLGQGREVIPPHGQALAESALAAALAIAAATPAGGNRRHTVRRACGRAWRSRARRPPARRHGRWRAPGRAAAPAPDRAAAQAPVRRWRRCSRI